jgi:hypothetical protein
MNDFLINKNATSIPWVLSPFFYQLLENDKSLSQQEKEDAIFFHENGYIIIDLNLSDDFIQNLKIDLLTKEYPNQESKYHYSDSPRIFEAWKYSNNVKSLSNHDKVLSTIEFLYNRKTIPFQTINFFKGSNQPLHSDTLHFHSNPENWLSACWVALEDVDEENGTLVFCPKSHKLPFYTFKDINEEPAEYGKQFDKYSKYEKFIEQIVLSNNLEIKSLVVKKGQALIWSANLLHGGKKIIDETRTRLSQVTHYYFDGCNNYYSPMFSDPFKGKISEKNIKEKNIREP